MSSFRKRHVQKPIRGTRTSPQTGQVITSSGNPSLDVLLGGGLPIGSICLIEEDKFVTNAKVLAKYFLAEGVISGQTVFLGSLDDDPLMLLNKLPKPLGEEELEQEKSAGAGEDLEQVQNGLRIAWRYNDLPIVNSEATPAKIGHHFNLLEQMDTLMMERADVATWHGNESEASNLLKRTPQLDDEETEEEDEVQDGTNKQLLGNICSLNRENLSLSHATLGELHNEEEAVGNSSLEKTASTDAMDVDTHKSDASELSSTDARKGESPQKPRLFENVKYLSLLHKLKPLLREDKFQPGAVLQKGLCRICITSLGSPLWFGDERFGADLLKFLTILRAYARSIVSVCFITMPMHLIAKYDEDLVAKIRNLVDFSIELESFAGSERATHPAFEQYTGLLHLRKLSAVNTLSAYAPETTDLVFKLRRKKFVIEKLHLPPELQETAGDTGCCSGKKNCSESIADSPRKLPDMAAMDF